MSFLNTTATLHHRTLLPSSVTPSRCLSIFSDHDNLITLDPDLLSYETLPPPPNARPQTAYYRITDNVSALPKGLWDSTVTFDAEITDTESGVEWVVKAPLGLVQRSVWAVGPAKLEDLLDEGEDAGGRSEGKEGKGKGGDGEGRLVLTEDVKITCSRLLVGTIKGKCEGNWRGVHGRFVGKVVAAVVEE